MEEDDEEEKGEVFTHHRERSLRGKGHIDKETRIRTDYGDDFRGHIA